MDFSNERALGACRRPAVGGPHFGRLPTQGLPPVLPPLLGLGGLPTPLSFVNWVPPPGRAGSFYRMRPVPKPVADFPRRWIFLHPQVRRATPSVRNEGLSGPSGEQAIPGPHGL